MSTVQHDNWCELADAVRVELMKRATRMADMDMSSLSTFVNLCQTACNQEIMAQRYDQKVDAFGND